MTVSIVVTNEFKMIKDEYVVNAVPRKGEHIDLDDRGVFRVTSVQHNPIKNKVYIGVVE